MARSRPEVRAKGITVCRHIDHAGGVPRASLPLRPTDLLDLRRGQCGTPLIIRQSIGIRLCH